MEKFSHTPGLVGLAKDRADWLLDAIAGATQDRRFLRGDPAYDEVIGEIILLNAEKAICVALDRAAAPELLEALRGLVEAMSRDGDPAFAHLIIDARAAIAMAMGDKS